MNRNVRLRNHPSYWTFVLHRVSGVLLVLFLPVHFYVLSLAIDSSALDKFLQWTAYPGVKFLETLLIVTLAIHLTGGLRLLALEFLPWSERQNLRIFVAMTASIFVGLIFLLN